MGSTLIVKSLLLGEQILSFKESTHIEEGDKKHELLEQAYPENVPIHLNNCTLLFLTGRSGNVVGLE